MGNTRKLVITTTPKTGWREPPRASDSLLVLPNGRSLKPTGEAHEWIYVEEATRKRSLERARSAGETPPPVAVEVSRIERIEASKGARAGDLSAEASSEVTSENPESTTEGSEQYGDDVEDVLGAAKELGDTSSIVSESDATNTEERFTEDEYLPTPAASSPQTTNASSPRLVQPSRHRAKSLRQGTETFRRHPTDATKVIVTYQVTDPAGSVYTQETDVPEVVNAPAKSPSGGGSIIVPDLEASKVPRAKKNSPWLPVPEASGYEWTRGEGENKETWRVNVFFRRLDRNTHAFEDIYVNVKVLNRINPNDKKFRCSYNKWVLQIARRRDASYTQRVVRVHWSNAERRALYTAINTFCYKKGIHKFGFSDDCDLTTPQLQVMADAVNAVLNRSRMEPRGVDAVRGQIASCHNKAQPKNQAILELLTKAAELRARMSGGEKISKAERRPRTAIPLAQFPIDQPVAAVAHSTPGGRKRKLNAVIEDTESSGSELSSLAASEASEVATDGELQLGGSEAGHWSDTSEETSSFPASKRTRRA